MGTVGSRPSCLGEKSPRSEDFLKDSYLRGVGLEAGRPARGKNNAADGSPPEKPPLSPRVIENGWSTARPGGPSKACPSSPLPKRNNVDVDMQTGGTSCNRLKACLELGAWGSTPFRSSGGSWAWKPSLTPATAATEVTEVTEVTETVVTEIVEVTEYPGGDRSRQPVVTRTVKVLAECAGTLPEVAAFRGHPWSSETAQEEALGKLLTWVRDMEELVASQKPLSSEAKVVRAQLQEQKLLQRLMDERRPSVERFLQQEEEEEERRPVAPEPSGAATEGGKRSLSSLREKWASLVRGAEARHSSLERILPAAHTFQESADSFQDWLGSAERELAQLWQVNGSLNPSPEAHQRIQDLCQDLRAKRSELEQALGQGEQLLEMVSGEEAQLARERMETLRMRFLMVSQSSTGILRRLEQAKEVSGHLDPTQRDLTLWLDCLEKEMTLEGGWMEGGSDPIAEADMARLQQVLQSEMDQGSRLSAQLEQLDPVCLDAEALSSQLANQKCLSAEILHHQGLVERLLPISDWLLSACPSAMPEQFQSSVKLLQEQTEQRVRRISAHGAQLEQAERLLAQFTEAHGELTPWLEEAPRAMALLTSQAVSCQNFREQQERLQALREEAAEHKPLLAKLRRVSAQLAELSPPQAARFRQGWQAAEEQYGSLREQLQQAAAVMEEAIPRYSQLSERMELLEECLERLQDRMEQPLAVRGDSAWLREQVRENSLRQGELERLGMALETLRGQGAELLATMQTSTDQGIHDHVAELLSQWEALWHKCEARETWLQGLLTLADRFWQGLSDLAATLSETQQMVLDLEEVTSDPKAIQAQLVAMQGLRGEIDSLQCDLDSLGILAMELMSSCGDLDKPDVTKSLDDLYSCWHNLNKVWMERQTHLEHLLQASQVYQEAMEEHFVWLQKAELRIAEEFLVGGDLEEVKQQLLELKEFKQELYQSKVDVESLRHQVAPKGGNQKDAPTLLCDFRSRWDGLEEEMVSRQHQLEASLLGLGQFQNQLEELLQWLLHTQAQIQRPPALSLDLPTCEIELAKHQVLRNDVLSRSHTVRSVEEAGQCLLLSNGRDSVAGLQGSLQQLSQQWGGLLGETEHRQLQLENHLCQVQDLTLEITELLQWLEHVELRLFFSRPLGDLPEDTKDRLAAHGELCKEMESKQHVCNSLRERVGHLLTPQGGPRPPGASSTEHSLSLLEQKWASVARQAQKRKEQLSLSLEVTLEFHSTVQDLLKWGERMQETLDALGPPSCILETINHQIQEQKALLQEAQRQGQKVDGLEATAGSLKDPSRPQEGDAAHSLVLSVKEGLAKVLQQVEQRAGALEEARKKAKQFQESWQMLMEWLDEVGLDQDHPSSIVTAALSQEGIRDRLTEHKEFQKGLRSKRPVYEATLRSGRLLCEKAQRPEDVRLLQEMLQELKERWDGVCGWAAERQCRLEENLLFSGCFTDALQTLMDWLYQAEPQLAEEMPVAGDRDLVSALMDKHKVFQKELGQRAVCIKTLRRSARDLIRGGSCAPGDSQWLQGQVEELGHRWEMVCQLSLAKQDRLEAALGQAEEFHTLVHSFLGHLSELEQLVKRSAFPKEEEEEEEEAALRDGQQRLLGLEQSLRGQQQPQLERIVSLGEEILSACHPDAVIPLRSWLAVAKTRFQEVLSWAQQQEERLQTRLATLAAEQEEVARLLDWIGAAEEALSLREQEPLPEEAQQLEELSTQHAGFMEELKRKQPEVEKVAQSGSPGVAMESGVAPAPRKSSSRRRGPSKTFPKAPELPLEDREPPNPRLAQLVHRWQQLWLLALDRQYRLQMSQHRLRELEEFARFDFAVWRKRYVHWIGQMKSRVLDVFRGMDRDQDGRITEREFIDGVLASKFPTNALEMDAVAKIFDANGDGFIDYYEFVSALHPSRDALRKAADVDQIQEEVNRQVAQCSCAKRFQVEQISENRYRFGESQQLRMVRILRSTLMVRVGGGWIALDEFLVKNDPCRVKGRTNVKLNEKYLCPDPPGGGKGPTSHSAPASKGLSPSGSSLSLYSSVSAPSSPLPRKAVLRRTRSGDRCLHARRSLVPEEAELAFSGATQVGGEPQETTPDPPGGPPP